MREVKRPPFGLRRACRSPIPPPGGRGPRLQACLRRLGRPEEAVPVALLRPARHASGLAESDPRRPLAGPAPRPSDPWHASGVRVVLVARRAYRPTAPMGRAQRRPEPQAERSDGPDRNSPCAPAEERSAMGCAGNLALQLLTHCACPNAVNEVNSMSCAMQPMARAPQVARSVSGGTGAPGSPSFASFAWRDKKSESGCGGEAPTSSHRSSVVVDRKHCVSMSTRGRDVRPTAQSLSLVSPRESNQREGDPGSHVPALALRAT